MPDSGHTPQLSPRQWGVFALAALVNILPMLTVQLGGDIFFHLQSMDCFGRQLWQGNWYPHWCFASNANLGLPIFLFYPPVAYYVSSLFYPLTWVGATLDQLYIISSYLATLLTLYTAWHWLRAIVTPKRAMMAAVLFIFIPYRMEAMFFRSAYAETWGMALMPLLFIAVRRMVRAEGGGVLFACSLALLCLTHLPSALVGCLFCGLYTMLMCEGRWQLVMRYVLAASLGFAMAAFQLVPAAYYRRFISGYGVFSGKPQWANTFLHMENLLPGHQQQIVLPIALTLLACGAVALWLWRARQRIAEPFIRREAGSWCLLFLFAVFFLLPVSKPFYDAGGAWAMVFFPWRMQQIFLFFSAYAAAIYLQYILPPKRKRTLRTDYALVLGLLCLLAFFIVNGRSDAHADFLNRILAAHYSMQEEYVSSWTDKPYTSQEFVLNRQAQQASIPHAVVMKGEGAVSVPQWGWSGITVQTQASQPLQVQLDHHYFPLWAARDEHGNPISLRPQAHTGLMLLEVPAGQHRVSIIPSIAQANPALVHASWLISMLAACAALLMHRKRWLYA